PAALAVDGRGDNLFVGTTAGELVRIDLHAQDLTPAPAVAAGIRPGARITSLGFLIGDRTLVVGDEAGGVETWQLIRGGDGEPTLAINHVFRSHGAPVVLFTPSARHKGFWTGDTAGTLAFDYATTGETLLELHVDGSAAAVVFAPKSDALVAIGNAGELSSWDVVCP